MVNQNKIFSFKIKRQTENIFPRDVEKTVNDIYSGSKHFLAVIQYNNKVYDRETNRQRQRDRGSERVRRAVFIKSIGTHRSEQTVNPDQMPQYAASG